MTSFWQTCENLKSPITRMTTKFNTRKLISNFILFKNLKINLFFLLFCFHKRTVLRNLVSITATSFCLKFTLAEGSLRSLFKRGFYPPKCGNVVKMSDARNFLDFFLEQRVLRSHRGIVHPPAAIIDRATRADRGVETPPLIG